MLRKKRLLIFIFSLCLIMASVATISCKKSETKPEPSEESGVTVTIDHVSLDLRKYETAILSATASDGSEITFSSSDNAVATVAEDGTISAVGVGGCSVTAKAGKASASCKITVTASPYASDIKGVSDNINLVKNGQYSVKLCAEFNGEKIDDKIDYSVSLTENASENIATASVNADGLLTVTGVNAGTTSFSVFATVRETLAEKTFSVKVYGNDVVIEPTSDDFQIEAGGYGLSLTTLDGAHGLKDEADLDFAVTVNGVKSDKKIEWDTTADYNADFDSAKAEVTGDSQSGYAVTAKRRGKTTLVGKYATESGDVFVRVNIEIRLPEKKLTGVIVARESAEIICSENFDGTVEEMLIDGTVVSTVNGNNVTLDKSKLPDNGNSLMPVALTIYTDKYCYVADAKMCTDIVTTAEDFENLKMQSGAVKAIYGYYLMTKDIDFASYGQCSAIRDDFSNAAVGFRGVFDGNGFKITNITVAGGGLFGHLGTGAVVKNVKFEGVSYNNVAEATLLARTIMGAEIENVSVTVKEYSALKGGANAIGLLSARFLRDTKMTDVTIDASGIDVINIFGFTCMGNTFDNFRLTAKSYGIIGYNSTGTADESTRIKELPEGIEFIEK